MLNKLKSGHWPIFLLSSFSSFANLFLPIILVRLLSPEEIGIYKIFFLHLSTIPFLVLAGGPVHSVFYWVGKKEEERKAYLNSTWTLTVLLSSLVLLIGFPFSSIIANYLDIPYKYVVYLLIAGFFACPNGHFIETTIAKGKSAFGSIFDTICEILKVVGFIAIAWYTKNVTYLFLYFVTMLGLKLIVTMYLNKKMNDIQFNFNKEHLTVVWKYCFPMAFSGLLGFFVDKIDLLFLSGHLDSAAFAFYSMGCLAIPPLYLLEMSVQKVLIPNLSKNYVDKDWANAAESYRKAIRDIALLIIPAIFGLCIFAVPIVKILYTEQYLESAVYLQLFAFSYLLIIFPHDSVARATGHTGWVLKIYLIITPISLLAANFAAMYLGAKGVLIVALIVKFIPKYFGMRLSKKLMHWSWKDMFPVKNLLQYISICSALTVLCFLFRPSFSSDIMWFLVCGTSFAVIYLSSVFLIFKAGKYA